MAFKDFFSENNRWSMTRLVTFISVVVALLLALVCAYYIYIGKIITELVYLIGVILSFSAGVKIGNKMQEVKEKTNDDKDIPSA